MELSNINKKADKKPNTTTNKTINIYKKQNIKANKKSNTLANKTINSKKK